MKDEVLLLLYTIFSSVKRGSEPTQLYLEVTPLLLNCKQYLSVLLHHSYLLVILKKEAILHRYFKAYIKVV